MSRVKRPHPDEIVRKIRSLVYILININPSGRLEIGKDTNQVYILYPINIYPCGRSRDREGYFSSIYQTLSTYISHWKI